MVVVVVSIDGSGEVICSDRHVWRVASHHDPT